MDTPNTNLITPLGLLQSFLEDEDYDTQLIPVTPDQPFEILQVDLTDDVEGESVQLNMHFVNDVTQALGSLDDPDDVFLLNCLIIFPFQAQQDKKVEAMELILSLNRLLPIGSFGMSFPDRSLYYQYHLATEDRDIPENVILDVVGMMGFFVGEFVPKIKAVLQGELTAQAYLDELAKGGIELPPLKK